MPRFNKEVDKIRRDRLDPVRLRLLGIIEEYRAPVEAVGVRRDATGFDFFMNEGRTSGDMPKGAMKEISAVIREVSRKYRTKYGITYRAHTNKGAEFIHTGWAVTP
jgi:hypothetical protein